MVNTLFKKDFSQNKANDEDIQYLLGLHTSAPSLASKPHEEQIALNRAMLRSMFIAEELHGCFSVEDTDGVISFTITKI